MSDDTYEQYENKNPKYISAMWRFRMIRAGEWSEWIIINDADVGKIKKLDIRCEVSRA